MLPEAQGDEHIQEKLMLCVEEISSGYSLLELRESPSVSIRHYSTC